MKFRYWMAVYPFQMAGGTYTPIPTTQPIEVSEGAKLVSFEVEVPDDLFGALEVPARTVSAQSGDSHD
jgi:hypothetical protein